MKASEQMAPDGRGGDAEGNTERGQRERAGMLVTKRMGVCCRGRMNGGARNSGGDVQGDKGREVESNAEGGGAGGSRLMGEGRDGMGECPLQLRQSVLQVCR